MRVPVSESSESLRSLGVSTATADDFGAGVGRAQQQFGGAIEKIGHDGAGIAIEMERRRVVRDNQAALTDMIGESETWAQENVFNKRGAETDVFGGEEGFRKNVAEPLDKIYSKRIEGMSEKGRANLEAMWRRRRISLESRIASHYAGQQEYANREASVRAVDAARTAGGEQIRASVAMGSDGKLAISSEGFAEIYEEAAASQRVYVKLHGLKRTEKEINSEARKSVHSGAIEAMMAAGEFEQAGAYLDYVTKKHKGDFSEKETELARAEIERGKAQAVRAVEQQVQAQDFGSTLEALKAVSMGDMDLQSAAPVLRERFGEEGMAMVEAAEKRIGFVEPKHRPIVQNREYWDFLKRAHNYKPSSDKGGVELRKLMAETFVFGELGDAARDELYLVASGSKIGGLDADEFKIINQDIDELVLQAVKRNHGGAWVKEDYERKKAGQNWEQTQRVGGTDKDPVMSSEIAIELKSIAKRIANHQDMTLPQARQMLEDHPVFRNLRTATDLQEFEANLEAFQLSGQWGESYQSNFMGK